MIDIKKDMIDTLSNNLGKTLNDYIIEGLLRKGYVFQLKLEFTHFVIKNCRCEDNIDLKERTYYVYDTPFLLHNYKVDMDFTTIEKDRNVTFSANFGYIIYL